MSPETNLTEPKSLDDRVDVTPEVGVSEPSPDGAAEVVFDVDDVNVYYGAFRAIRNVDVEIYRNEITAFIGPSGCGKTTMLRCFNRMNDLIDIARVEGRITYHGVDLYDREVNPVEVRRRIGMVFQKPNPFPKSIYDNVAYGPRVAGMKGNMDDLVERALRGAGLWDEVKSRLKASGMGLSGGQQQRLCIARAIATDPEVLLMDEPCSALDPIATARIEDLMQEIKDKYTIVIVTHNMQQAARVSDRTAFFTTEVNPESDTRTGMLVEVDSTDKIFSNPGDERTENYVTGRFGVSVGDTVEPMRHGFREELDQLKLQVEIMGIRVDENLERMRTGLRTGDADLSLVALDADNEIDAMNVSLTERCYLLLGRESPVASDLRFIVSVLRIVSELERIGDLALRVVKLTPKHDLLARSGLVFDILLTLGDESVEMYRVALRAWAAQDLALATGLATEGRNLDLYYERLVRELKQLDGPDAVRTTLAAFAAGRGLERIADHSAIIGARLRYLITGEPAHLAAEVR